MSLINNIKKIFFDFLYPDNQGQIIIPKSEELLEKSKRDTEFDGKEVLAIFSYKDQEVKKLIWQLKYKGNEEAAKTLAKVLHQEILEALSDWLSFEDFKDPVLIPTPISKKKTKIRGYNQTEMVLKEMEKIDEGKNFSVFYDVLNKKKDTPDQSSTKSKKERLANLKDCFSVKDAKKIKDRNIILIDDVITTGTTVKEMRKALKKGGARKVKAVVIAH